MPYKVLVDDNFHYMDESERYLLGEYDSCEAAVEACKKMVDTYLLGAYKPGMAAGALFDSYKSFGEDPYVAGDDAECRFSAWVYAQHRCEVLCEAPNDLTPRGPNSEGGAYN